MSNLSPYTKETTPYIPLTRETTIGMIRILYRVDKLSKEDIANVLTILNRGGYTNEEKEFLNECRKRVYSLWRTRNIILVREVYSSLKGLTDNKLLFVDLDNPKDNTLGCKDWKELSNYKPMEDLYKSHLIIVVSPSKEEIKIEKARFFT